MNESLITVLPENIAKKLGQALAHIPGGETAKIEKPKGEGAFNHILLITTDEERYVFRARRESSSEEIEAYMRYMYEATSFLEAGGIFKLRNIAEEIDFIKSALAVGLPVPKLIHADTDWMLIEYIEGRTFHEFVKAGEVEILPKILRELNLAHTKGIIYGDRWGDNEIIDSQGNVRMIDFDIEWSYEGVNDGIVEALEMAVPIFHSLRLTSTRNDLLNIVQNDALPLLKSWGYKIDMIGKFIQGFCNFYLDPNKPSNIWSLPPELYVSMTEPANRLIAIFSEAE
ncbi:hypothetical protein [Coleofasciculus sp. H7-2]|uniref:hypothetical protein n=1 Tax=Coleofasciculus sp. H7-2 TaxID=3351545 RepID=UPI003671C7E1